MGNIKAREEIDDKYKWDLTTIFKSINEFNKFYDETKKIIEEFPKYENHVMDSSDSLLEVLEEDSNLSRRIEKLYSYTSLLSDQDKSNNKNQELLSKVVNLYELAIKNTYFIRTEILKSDKTTIDKYIEENDKLKDLKKYIDRIYRYKKYTLSDKEESLLSNLTPCFGNDHDTYSLLTDSDMTFGTIKDEEGKEVELTDTNYSNYIKSPDRRVRKEAFNKLYNTYKQYKDTIGTCLNGHVKQNTVLARIRGYNSLFEKELYRDELNKNVYEALKDAVHSNLDVYQRYFKLKKQALGLDEMHCYDAAAEIIKDNKTKYSVSDAKKIIFDALKPLGEDYLKDLEKAFTEKWIDFYPNKNKRGGGYSAGTYDTNPFILINYQEKLDDVSTLIHELGHSMHSYYSKNNNKYEYWEYPIFTAEVASTTNELLLNNYLINNSKDEKIKKAAIDNLLELFRGALFFQTMYEEFEEYAYSLVEENDVITADKLCDKYYELNKLYYGDSLIVDEEIKYHWERVPHFYYNFYVYKYATSLSAACDIVTRILNKEENAVENYLKMLKSGNSYSPLETLKIAGVDMTKKEVYENAIKMFDDTLNEFEKLLENNKEMK